MRSKPFIESGQVEEHPPHTWINAHDEVPDDDRIVVIYMPHASVFPVWLGWWCDKDRVWCWETGDTVPQMVSHWMDLPEGPHGSD